MRKSEIIERIAAELDLTKVKAEETIDAIVAEVKTSLSRGEPVIVRRFGTFSVHAKAAREGHNPKTGQAAEIALAGWSALRLARRLKRRSMMAQAKPPRSSLVRVGDGFPIVITIMLCRP